VAGGGHVLNYFRGGGTLKFCSVLGLTSRQVAASALLTWRLLRWTTSTSADAAPRTTHTLQTSTLCLLLFTTCSRRDRKYNLFKLLLSIRAHGALKVANFAACQHPLPLYKYMLFIYIFGVCEFVSTLQSASLSNIFCFDSLLL